MGVYSDKPLRRLPSIPRVEYPLEMTSLDSLIDYIKSGVDTMLTEMLLSVVSPTRVVLESGLNPERERETLARVSAVIPDFSFNQFVEKEKFNIGLQSNCIGDGSTDKDLLLKFTGTVEAGTIAQYGDDGVSQKATIKTGIASKSEALVPNPVTLKPYRTFIEVDQPSSEFVFRMKETHGEILCAIYEADGGAWEMEARKNIKSYLEKGLTGLKGFTVLC